MTYIQEIKVFMRLDRYLSNHKVGSRQEVKKIIKGKLVTVNQMTIVDPSFDIDMKKDEIFVDHMHIKPKTTAIYMLNKPKGYVCARKDNVHPTVLSLFSIDEQEDLNIVGRLDIDTEGLLLLTNDGPLIHALTSPRKDVYKTYIVETEEYVEDLDMLLKPMMILDGNNMMYQPKMLKVNRLEGHAFSMSIKEGKFHQIKRMVLHCGHKVKTLKRISIGDITLDETLALGSYKRIEL